MIKVIRRESENIGLIFKSATIPKILAGCG
jgi:hypothetical protein